MSYGDRGRGGSILGGDFGADAPPVATTGVPAIVVSAPASHVHTVLFTLAGVAALGGAVYFYNKHQPKAKRWF